MIFVTVGTQLPFDRLLRGVDEWAATHPEMPVRAQTGHTGAANYSPSHMDCSETLSPDRFDQTCRAARLLIAHAGTGTLVKAFEHRVPLIMMPRRAALGEHRNDHQMAMAEAFQGRPGIRFVFDEGDLPTAIDEALHDDALVPNMAEFADQTLIAALRTAIFGTEKAENS